MRPPRGSPGYLLLETLLSLVIIMIAAIAVFSVAVGCSRAQLPMAPYEDMMRAAQSASEHLRDYISESTDTKYAPNGTWQLPGDTCSFALQLGCSHDGTTAFLSPEFRARWPSARLSYNVYDGGGGAMTVGFVVQR